GLAWRPRSEKCCWRCQSIPDERAVLELCRASVSDAARRRFTERSRGDASAIEGQLVRASERARTSETPYNSQFQMSVIGIGVDVVECERIKHSIDRFGDR